MRSNEIRRAQREYNRLLEEFTQEQKTTNQTINDLIAAVNTIGSKVDDFKKELDKPNAVSVTTDTKPIQEIDNQKEIKMEQIENDRIRKS